MEHQITKQHPRGGKKADSFDYHSFPLVFQSALIPGPGVARDQFITAAYKHVLLGGWEADNTSRGQYGKSTSDATAGWQQLSGRSRCWWGDFK